MWRMYLTAGVLQTVRCCVAVNAAIWGGPVGWVYCLCELSFAFFAFRNIRDAMDADRRGVGLVVPAIYAASLFIAPEAGEPALWLFAAFCVVTGLRLWALWDLRGSYSTGVATWLCLRDRGLYGVVRHPMTAGAVLWRFLLLAAWPSAFNLATSLAFVALMVYETTIEEGFLKRQPAYLAYTARVRWRLVPGLW